MTEKRETDEDWCKSFSPGLAVFNKAFIRRAGKGLFPYVLLKGGKEPADICIRKEAELFYNAGIYDAEDVHTDITSDKRGVYSAGTWNEKEKDRYNALSNNGSIIFFTDGSPAHANEYDISGCSTFAFKEKIVPMMGMDISDDIIKKLIAEHPEIIDMDMMLVANNTMLRHYENADDEILTIKDFDWLDKADRGVSDKEPAQKERPVTLSEERPEKTESEQVEVPVPTEPAPEKKTEEKPAEKTDNKADRPAKEKPSETGSDKADKKTEINEYGLTADDEVNNQKLLREIKKEYDIVIAMIAKEPVPSMFAPLKRVLEASEESDDFAASPIKKYIEISKDFSTDVYNRLYKITEPLRLKFIKGVKKKIKHITCFNCSHEWDVDVTFMEGSIGESECPDCGTVVRFEP